MKKIIALLLTVVLILPLFPFHTSAEEYEDPYDALEIPPEIIEKIPEHENAEIIYRYYAASPRGVDWGEQIDVKAMAEFLVDKDGGYAVIISGVEKYYDINEEGLAVQTGEYTIDDDEIPFTMYEMLTREAIYAVSPDLQIESVYCFNLPFFGTYDGTIFYKTNMGDFVLFGTERLQPMMMTVRRFNEYLKAWSAYQKEQKKLHGLLMGARYTLELDFSSYDWTSPKFDPDAPLPLEKEVEEPEFPWLIVGIGAAVLAAAAVTTVLLIRKKKKKNEGTPETE